MTPDRLREFARHWRGLARDAFAMAQLMGLTDGSPSAFDQALAVTNRANHLADELEARAAKLEAA